MTTLEITALILGVLVVCLAISTWLGWDVLGILVDLFESIMDSISDTDFDSWD